MRQTWQKNLTVDKRIVRLLSAKTYEDFPGAIRELVSNAYDADATEVRIVLDLKRDFIEVTDDGNGMTPDEFDLFLRIAGQQRGRDTSPFFRRKRIGQFGIGFLAFFPFGKQATITSSARNSEIRFEATVPTESFILEDITPMDIEKIVIPGTQTSNPKYLETHGTTIRISGLTELVSLFFKPRTDTNAKNRQPNSIRSWDGMKRLKWWLSENLPVDYPKDSVYKQTFADIRTSGLKVWFNREEILRNVPGTFVLDQGTWEFEEIRCKYIITTDWKSIVPYEERGLKQRLGNVGVGERTNFDLQTHGKTYSRLHWLTGEIHFLEGVNKLVAIDRAKFLDTPEMDQLRDFFRAKLSYYALYLEDVDTAKREINQQFSESRAAEVGQKKDIVQRNLTTLEKKGFQVITKNISEVSSKADNQFEIPFKVEVDPQKKIDVIAKQFPPVKIDVENKIVEVFQDHPEFLDTIEVGNKVFTIRYVENLAERKIFSVRKAEGNIIEINTAYPLFNSKRYGEVFKKTLVTALVLVDNSKTPQELLQKLTKQLPNEFFDL